MALVVAPTSDGGLHGAGFDSPDCDLDGRLLKKRTKRDGSGMRLADFVSHPNAASLTLVAGAPSTSAVPPRWLAPLGQLDVVIDRDPLHQAVALTVLGEDFCFGV